MNTLHDDLRDLLRRQADAMPVPAPDLDQQLARVTSLDTARQRRWLLPAAAVAVVAVGGLALAQRTTPDMPAPTATAVPPADAGAPTVPFVFELPRVRMTAERIEVIDGDRVVVPADVRVEGDPGDDGFTTLELSWVDSAAVTQRIHLYFASDGVSWWATEIRTTDAAGEWVVAPQGQQWFTSPLGTAWTGDLDLPNLRITGLTVEAFLPPVACGDPTSPIAVVSPYVSVDGWAGDGFGGRIDLIDTATCTAIDPTPYLFTTVVDDPSIAVVVAVESWPTATTVVSEMTTVPGVPPAPTTTVTAPAGTYGVDAETAPPEPFARFTLELLRPGSTTVRVTVTDAAGAVIGTVALPVTVRADTTGPTTTIVPAETPLPEDGSAEVLAQAAYRVSATPALATLGYSDLVHTIDP